MELELSVLGVGLGLAASPATLPLLPLLSVLALLPSRLGDEDREDVADTEAEPGPEPEPEPKPEPDSEP